MYQNNKKPRPKPKRLASPKWLFVAALSAAVILIILPIGLFFIMQGSGKGENGPAAATRSFDKTKFSLIDPASPWVIVNKKRPLEPKNYEPAGLRTPNMKIESSAQKVNDQTASALEALAGGAAAEGVNLILVSAHRSYSLQAVIYDSEVRAYGQAQADRESARPGHSEHQTGWAADLGAENGKCRIEACFGDTPEGKWLAANAYKFGFIIRYPQNKENVTGYMYEPWHLRYVGKELSEEMHRTGIKTLEEFFSLPAAPAY